MTYDGVSNNLVAVTDSGGARTASMGRDALGRTLGISDGAGAQLAFSDLRGDLIGAFTADGAALVDSVAYDPFGEVITRTGATHTLGYQGGYTDPDSGKINMAARWYQPATGSFVSRDTLTQAADPSVQLNRYAYANDNPLTNVDLDGHKTKKKQTTTATSKKSPPTGAACNKKYGKKACNEVKQDHTECVEYYGKKGCATQESTYLGCRKNSSMSKCEQNEIRTECANGARHQPYEHGTCKYTVDDYKDCRSAKYGRGECREGAMVYAGCIAGGNGRQACGEGSDIYQSCRAGHSANRAVARDICGNTERIYWECRETDNKDTCTPVSSSYGKCRDTTEQGHANCESYAESYLTCRSSQKYRKHNDQFCSEVQEAKLRCLDKYAMKDCGWIHNAYMECAKAAGSEQKCTGEDGVTGAQCNKDKSICTYSLNNADTWLIAGMLIAVGGAAGICALSTAATVIGLPLSTICAVAGVIAGLAGGALSYLNRDNHGIWIKITVTPPYMYRGVVHKGDPIVTWGSQ